MSHCKACEAAIDKKVNWRVFNDNEDFNGLLPEEDDLCSKCLQIVEECFHDSFFPPAEQERAIQTYFYKDREVEMELDTSSLKMLEYY